MPIKPNGALCKVREQIVEDDASGLILQFECANGRTRLVIAGDALPFGNREILFDDEERPGRGLVTREQPIEPLARVGGAARRQVHAAVAQIAQDLLDHSAAVLGRQRVERPGERVREVALVEDTVLVQRLDQHDVGRGEAGEGLEQGVELPVLPVERQSDSSTRDR